MLKKAAAGLQEPFRTQLFHHWSSHHEKAPAWERNPIHACFLSQQAAAWQLEPFSSSVRLTNTAYVDEMLSLIRITFCTLTPV